MKDLAQRLGKYLPTTSSITEEKIVAPIELPRETAGVLLWNLIVKYISDYNDIHSVDCPVPNYTVHRIREQHKGRLFIAVEEFIIANDSRNRKQPCIGLTKKLLDVIISIVRATLAYSKSKYLVKCSRSLEILEEMVSEIPEILKTAHAEMESELFIESMLVPMAATLVTDTRKESERVLGFKIWDFVSQYSQSAGQNHGIYFGPIMLNFCLKYNKTGKKYGREKMPEQIEDLHKVFDQILSCIQTHAFTERSDSFLNTFRPNARYTSYFHAFNRETIGEPYTGFGSPHPFIYKLMLTAFNVNRYQRRGGLHGIITILHTMHSHVMLARKMFICKIDRNIFEYLLDGIFAASFAVFLQDTELGLHEKSQRIGTIMDYLCHLCAEYTGFIVDEETELSLLQKLRKLDLLAKIHCCPSCYPGTSVYWLYPFLKHVLHQEDTPPFLFYRQPEVTKIYTSRIKNDPYYAKCILQRPETCRLKSTVMEIDLWY